MEDILASLDEFRREMENTLQVLERAQLSPTSIGDFNHDCLLLSPLPERSIILSNVWRCLRSYQSQRQLDRARLETALQFSRRRRQQQCISIWYRYSIRSLIFHSDNSNTVL